MGPFPPTVKGVPSRYHGLIEHRLGQEVSAVEPFGNVFGGDGLPFPLGGAALRRFFGRNGEIGHEAGVGEHEQSRTADGGDLDLTVSVRGRGGGCR